MAFEQRSQPTIITDTMSDRMFSRFSRFIQAELGIKMPPAKKTMLQARLLKRLRKLGIETFGEYHDFLFSPQGMKEELPFMINVVTTNKTDFFRESRHFDELVEMVLPDVRKKHGAGTQRPLRVWSAGCATGEEVYTLAMILNEYRQRLPQFRFSVFGTDISTEVLQMAAMGIYEAEKVEPVPLPLKKKYLLKSKDRKKKLVRIVPELRSQVRFRCVNFMSEDFGFQEIMDVVFCRNVIIYFDRRIQEEVLGRICRYIVQGGYLFIGHSETLNGLNLPLEPVLPTIYRKI